MRRTRIGPIAAICTMAAVLAACGGGDGDDGDTPPAVVTEVPPSAQGSVEGLVAYLRQLITDTNETAEPVVIGNVVLPQDDTAEPAPVR